MSFYFIEIRVIKNNTNAMITFHAFLKRFAIILNINLNTFKHKDKISLIKSNIIFITIQFLDLILSLILGIQNQD